MLVERYDLILQPKNGTHHRHAMAALTNRQLFDSNVSEGECVTADWKCFEEHPEKTVPVARFAAMWCEMFGLDLDGQPEGLLEGANQTDGGYACMEVKYQPFVQMLYCIYGAAQPGGEGRWDSMRLNPVLMERHFIVVESEDETPEPEAPAVTRETTAKREEEYDIRVLSDGTYQVRGRGQCALGQDPQKVGAWHGPFPADEFPVMFPGQTLGEDTIPMTKENPRWGEFAERLSGPEGCNFRKDPDFKFTCDGTVERPRARLILARMGLSAEAVEASMGYFAEHGGYCDCEILFNVDN